MCGACGGAAPRAARRRCRRALLAGRWPPPTTTRAMSVPVRAAAPFARAPILPHRPGLFFSCCSCDDHHLALLSLSLTPHDTTAAHTLSLGHDLLSLPRSPTTTTTTTHAAHTLASRAFSRTSPLLATTTFHRITSTSFDLNSSPWPLSPTPHLPLPHLARWHPGPSKRPSSTTSRPPPQSRLLGHQRSACPSRCVVEPRPRAEQADMPQQQRRPRNRSDAVPPPPLSPISVLSPSADGLGTRNEGLLGPRAMRVSASMRAPSSTKKSMKCKLSDRSVQRCRC